MEFNPRLYKYEIEYDTGCQLNIKKASVTDRLIIIVFSWKLINSKKKYITKIYSAKTHESSVWLIIHYIILYKKLGVLDM